MRNLYLGASWCLSALVAKKTCHQDSKAQRHTRSINNQILSYYIMKKTFLITAFILLLGAAASGQDYRTSLGLRLGYPYGVTVKHFLNKYNALEGILASSWGGFVATGLYEYERWTGKYPGLNWFCGAGAYAGFWDAYNHPLIDDSFTGTVIGAGLIAGLEYTFDEVPVNISIDMLPTFNLIGYTGWGGFSGAISVRYVF